MLQKENFCFIIHNEAFDLVLAKRKIFKLYNPTIEEMIVSYIECLKQYPNVKTKLIEAIKKDAVNLTTLKQSLKYMVMNEVRTPPHYKVVEDAVSYFIEKPQDVIIFLKNNPA
jgi:hypothetical protein